MNRLFAFGCSLSYYCWPTWADLIAPSFSEYYNSATPGAGNRFIHHQVYEADSIKNFSCNDTVLVMLTNTPRVDSFLLSPNGEFRWQDRGAVYQPNNQHILKNLMEFWSFEQGILETYLAAKSIKTLLTARGTKHKILLGIDWDSETQQEFEPYTDATKIGLDLVSTYIYEAYNILDVKESFYSYSKKHFNIDEYYSFDLPAGRDHHPNILMSVSYIRDHLPEYYTNTVQTLANCMHAQIDNRSHDANWENPEYRRLRGKKLGTSENLTYYLDRVPQEQTL